MAAANNFFQNDTPFWTKERVSELFASLDFWSTLPDDVEKRVEKVTATELWEE